MDILIITFRDLGIIQQIAFYIVIGVVEFKAIMPVDRIFGDKMKTPVGIPGHKKSVGVRFGNFTGYVGRIVVGLIYKHKSEIGAVTQIIVSKCKITIVEIDIEVGTEIYLMIPHHVAEQKGSLPLNTVKGIVTELAVNQVQ